MTGNITVKVSAVTMSRKRWWWPFSPKHTSPTFVALTFAAPDDMVGTCEINIPARPLHRIGTGEFCANPIEVRGVVKYEKRDHHVHVQGDSSLPMN
jgi:hypothetical protein